MRPAALLLVLLFCTTPEAKEPPFTGMTFRLDLDHSGRSDAEEFGVRGFSIEGPFSGPIGASPTLENLGQYRFTIGDVRSKEVLFRRGYSSKFGEWQTTAEAKKRRRSIAETLFFPEPRGVFSITIEKRRDDGGFKEIWKDVIDPASYLVHRAAPVPMAPVIEIAGEMPPEKALDILVLGDGYTAAERTKFESDTRRLAEKLLTTPPFSEFRRRIRVRAMVLPAKASGIDDPRSGTRVRSPLGLAFNTFDSDRYVLADDDVRVMDAAQGVPHDALILLANSKKYGGGGIFGLYSTCTSDSEDSPYVFVHEFGHHLAALADEYYTSQIAYEDLPAAGVEPWESNITSTTDASRIKWAALLTPGTPVPTPWNQDAYDKADLAYQKERQAATERGASAEEMAEIMRRGRAGTTALIGGEKYRDAVGAFEGGGYRAKGIYRPALDCIMFSRRPSTFCPVCAEAIRRVLSVMCPD